MLHKFNESKVNNILNECKVIHVSDAQTALIAQEFLKISNKEIPITVGVYHTLEFSWKIGAQPYFEKINRKFIYEILESTNLLCYSQSTKDYLAKETGYAINNAKVFRLGVVDKIDKPINLAKKDENLYKICTVGRLVDFKTYNFWLPKVISDMNLEGYNIILDIYGDGDKKEKVKDMVKEYHQYSNLLPEFEYSKFDSVVREYDLFIGSGTAIVQAASLGIPCIIGIESIKKPLTYGFFSDFYKYEYHLDSLPFNKVFISELIKNYISSSIDQKNSLKVKHKLAADEFNIEKCSLNMEDNSYLLNKYYTYNKYLYHFSKILFQIKLKVMKKTIYHKYL